MAVGYIANTIGVVNDSSNKHFSKYIVNIAIPFTIINPTINQVSIDKMEVLRIMGFAIGMFIFIPAISFIIVKILKIERTYELMLNYSNLGFMGIPVISSMYGEKAVFYISIFMMIFNISIFSHGVIILNANNDNFKINLKSLLNSGIISAFIALAIFMFKIPVHLYIRNILSSVSNSMTPLAMIVIGSTLADVEIKDVFTDKMLYVFTLLKMFVYPLMTYAVLYAFGGNSMVVGITVILVGLPVAGNISMICSEYDGNIELVTKGIFMSTVFSIISLPILMLLF